MGIRDAVPYVAAAYLVVLATIILYVLLIGQKLTRIERDLDAVERELDERGPVAPGERS